MATILPNSFSPLSISGCTLWLNGADRFSVISSAGAVSQWNDRSSSANNAVTITGAPTYSGSNVGFNLSNSDLMRTSASNAFSIGSTTMYYVAQVQTVMGVLQDFIAFPDAGTKAVRYVNGILLGTAASTGDANDYGNSNYYVNGFFNPNFSASTYVTTHQVSAVSVNMSGNSRINLSDSFMSRYFSGSISELLFYSSAPTTLQRQQLEGYLGWKWGIQGSLPASHPFRYAPPNASGSAVALSIPLTLPRQSGTGIVSPIINFLPTSISNCALWLDAADPNTLATNGSRVLQWNDKSGNGRNTSTVYGTPLLRTGAFGSRPSIYFNSNAAFTGSITNTGTTVTAFVVGRLNTSGNPYRLLSLGQAGRYDFGTTTDMVVCTTGNATTELGWYRNFGGTGIGGANVATIYNAGFVYDVTVDGSTGVIWLNGGTTASGTTSGSFGYPNYALGVGFTISGLYAWLVDGYIAEVIVYNAALATAQRQQVEGYLAWKWGLQGSLSSGHPYKSNPPNYTGPLLLYNLELPAISFQGATFRPSQISGLQLWLDATDPLGTGIVPVNGATMSTWYDKSGNGRNMIATGSITYSTYGNIGSLLFNNTYMRVNSAVNLTDLSVFAVSRCQTAKYNQVCLTGIPQTGFEYNSTDGFAMFIDSDAGSQRDRFYGSGIANTVFNSNPSGADAYPLRSMCWINTSTGLLSSWYNGNTGNVNANGSNRTSTATGFTIGLSQELALANCVSQFSEFIVYNTVLTTGQRQSVEGYLAWKWNLVSNLPANHPFKKFPPSPL